MISNRSTIEVPSYRHGLNSSMINVHCPPAQKHGFRFIAPLPPGLPSRPFWDLPGRQGAWLRREKCPGWPQTATRHPYVSGYPPDLLACTSQKSSGSVWFRSLKYFEKAFPRSAHRPTPGPAVFFHSTMWNPPTLPKPPFAPVPYIDRRSSLHARRNCGIRAVGRSTTFRPPVENCPRARRALIAGEFN